MKGSPSHFPQRQGIQNIKKIGKLQAAAFCCWMKHSIPSISLEDARRSALTFGCDYDGQNTERKEDAAMFKMI